MTYMTTHLGPDDMIEYECVRPFLRFFETDVRYLYLQELVKCAERACKFGKFHPKGHKACATHSLNCVNKDNHKITAWRCLDCANLLILAATNFNVDQYSKMVAACFFVSQWKNVTKIWERLTAPVSTKKFPFLHNMLYEHIVYDIDTYEGG